MFMTRRDDLPIGPTLGSDWQELGRCSGRDDIDWFPDMDAALTDAAARELVEPAKALCRICVVAEKCLKWALDTNQEFGVWGGTDEYDRGRKPGPRKRTQASSTARKVRLVVVRPVCPGCYVVDAVVPYDASHLTCLDCAITWPAPLS
jgi:WhiB family redox-sensing transcriptional regulator